MIEHAPEKPSICFVALNIYPALADDGTIPIIGGAEVQQIQIGQGLSDRGWQVSYVTRRHGDVSDAKIGSFAVYPSFVQEAGIPVVRFVYPRATSIWSAMRRADADVYFVRAASFLPGLVRLFCRVSGRQFVFSGALDTDFDPQLVSVSTIRDRWMYQYGLRGARDVLVQNQRQKSLLLENFGIQGHRLPNFLLEGTTPQPNTDSGMILWVSTIRRRKRPLMFVDAARKMPDKRFVMVGGKINSHAALYDEVAALAADTPNLDFLGFQSFSRTEELMNDCSVFVNTSLYEGFPNTFLQAWRRGVPVVSFVDPDSIISAHSLGVVLDSQEDMHQAIRSASDFDVGRRKAIQSYYAECHGPKVMDRYEAVLLGKSTP